MSHVLQGFQWVREDTPVHRLDPRAKILWFSCILMLTVIVWDPIILTLLLASLTPISLTGRVVAKWVKALRAMTMFILIVTLIDILYYGPILGLITGFKFVIITSAFSIFFMTTHLDDLAAALTSLGVPYTFSFILVTSARYVPTLVWETQEIMDAYKARGIELERGRWRSLRNYSTMLVPLIISTTRRSMRLAEAMEARAFGYTKKREVYRVLRLRRADVELMVATVALTSLALVYYFTQLM